MQLVVLILFNFILVTVCSADIPYQTYSLLNETFVAHMNYFLGDNGVTSYGLPLTAYKVGDRARYGYSNPTEWGYLLQAYIAAAERSIITREEAIEKINVSLNTMLTLQQDSNQNYQKLFYPYYKVTDSNGNDIFPYHDQNVNIPSIDNGLLYMSLLITEGWAEETGNAEIENKSKTIKDQMDFSIFLFTEGSNTYLAHLVNANTDELSSSKWDVFADEGGLMTLVAYFSDSVNFSVYQELTNSQLRSPAAWNGHTVEEASWFNSMFAWGVRSIAGFKVFGTDFSTGSFVPAVNAHLDYGDFINVSYPGFSDAMTQAGGVGRYTPPNLANEVPDYPPEHIMPHAFFIPFNILPDLDNATIQKLEQKISMLKNDASDYYHDSGLYPYGFEVLASPYINDTGYSGSAEGRNIFETLSQGYIVLSLFNALQYTNNSKDFYGFANNVPGYGLKVKNVLEFLYPTKGCVTPYSGMIISRDTVLCRGASAYVVHYINIVADNIVVDCNNSYFDGKYSGTLFNIYGRKNITLKNCNLREYVNGIILDNTSDSSIINNYCIWRNNYCVTLQHNSNRNKIRGNKMELSWDSGLTITNSNNNLIENNYFVGNEYRNGIHLYNTHNNTIKNNGISNNGHMGSWYYHGGIALLNSNNNNIFNNSIVGNSYGIYSSSTENYIQFNNIYDNTRYDLNNQGDEDINAENNWWGTTNCSKINQEIYDKKDYISKGYVNFIPLLDSFYHNGTPVYCDGYYDLYLKNGWNLISPPIEPFNNSIGSIMSKCDYNRIWEFQPDQSWTSTDSGLTEMNIYHGYWIDRTGFNDSCIITIEGVLPNSTTINITSNWTLVGYPSLNSKEISTFINASLYERIWEFQPDQSWISTDTGLTNMTPGKGYWIDGTVGGSYVVSD